VLRTAGRPRARRAAVVVALLTAVLAGPLLGATAAVAAQDKSGTRAVTTRTAAVVPGQSAWLAVVWTADRTVTKWSTTVSAPAGVGVSYPTTRGGSDTSLYGSATLVGGTSDFTAFKLQVPHTRTTSFEVTLTSSYVDTCGDNGRCKNNGGGNDDKERAFSTTATVTVPVRPATGPAFTQDTSTIEVAAGSNAFHDIAFTGGEADLADFAVRLGALPPGLSVAYPGDAAAGRPSLGASLVGGGTDRVAVRLDTTGLAAGRYAVPLVITYTDAAPRTASGTVTLVVR
jgi:hypothetical protein